MKILVCLIAVLAITAPVLATTVTISGEVDGNNLTLNYHTDGVLRGIALAIDTGGAATTNAAGTTLPASGQGIWNVCLDHAYDVVTAEGTYNLDTGSPLAIIDGPGVPVGDVGDETGFSICVGYVDDIGGVQAGVNPGSQETPLELCTIALSGPCTVTVAGDTLRGGAVGSPVDIILDMDNDGTPDDGTIVVGSSCPSGGTEDNIAKWNAWGKPANWCGDCWAEGDVDGDCAVTFADVQMVNGDYLNDQTPEALTGRSDNDMDGAITFADVQKVNGAYLNDVLCPQPCTPLE